MRLETLAGHWVEDIAACTGMTWQQGTKKGWWQGFYCTKWEKKTPFPVPKWEISVNNCFAALLQFQNFLKNGRLCGIFNII